jgi:uncharacterized membrane protein
MTLLSQAKTLGGVGSILLLLTIAPSVGFVLGIVGLILILVALKYVSDAVNDKSIFNNAIIAIVLAIVGIVVAGAVVISYLLSYIGLGSLSSLPMTFRSGLLPPGGLLPLLSTIIIALAAVWIFYVVSAIFLRRSFGSVSTKLNVGMFQTAALIYLIGAALTIVLVGFVLIFVADILFIIAFFSIPETIAPQSGLSNQP